MIRFTVFTLLFGLALCAPTSNVTQPTNEDKVVINNDLFPDEFKIYTAEHDIVNILVPINALNFDDDEDDNDDDEGEDNTLFFIEADITNGVKEYKGLSVIKNKQAKKLLETGTDAAADNGNNKKVYFSATDGLYVYDEKNNTAVKYGPITDSIISLAKVNGSDLIYILTANNEVYKVTDDGSKKVKLDNVVGAQQIVLDYSNNLYYYDTDKQTYVVGENGVKKIEGLPSNATYMNLLKPPFVVDDGVPIVINDKGYLIYANGTSDVTDFALQVIPTAYSMEATLIQYFGYNKSIYEYNILAIMMGGLMEELRNFFQDKTEEIQSIATRSRTGFKP